MRKLWILALILGLLPFGIHDGPDPIGVCVHYAEDGSCLVWAASVWDDPDPTGVQPRNGIIVDEGRPF